MPLIATTVISAWLAAAVGVDLDIAQRCATIDEPTARLACYDHAFGRTEPAPVPAGVRGRDTFGLSEHQQQALDPQRPRGLDRIEATVTELADGGNGQRRVTLDSGQIWVGSAGKLEGRLSRGDPVVIRKGSMSSHLLVTPAGVAVRVRRIR